MLKIRDIIQNNAKTLLFSWIAAEHSERRLDPQDRASASDLVGHLNVIHPTRIQVFGRVELVFFERKSERQRLRFLEDFLCSNVPCIIFAENLQSPDILIKFCQKNDVPLVSSPRHAAHVIDGLRDYLGTCYAPSHTMHGVFLDVLGIGVMITGESGLGKSELALELISRGHGLVADDAVEFTRTAPALITGTCPPLLRNLLEVRGLGLLDICTIFGESSVRRRMTLRLIVHLSKDDNLVRQRLPQTEVTQDVLGVPIRSVVLQVAAGRNLAVLVEAAVRDAILKLRGIDTVQEFIKRQAQAIHAQPQTKGEPQ